MPRRPFAVIPNTAYTRMAKLLGAIGPDVSSMKGNLYPGIQTVRVSARTVPTFDDWFTSDLILMWHKNSIVTRIPDAHFLMEARYNGTRLVNISRRGNGAPALQIRALIGRETLVAWVLAGTPTRVAHPKRTGDSQCALSDWS